jgi:hypothetical protein
VSARGSQAPSVHTAPLGLVVATVGVVSAVDHGLARDGVPPQLCRGRRLAVTWWQPAEIEMRSPRLLLACCPRCGGAARRSRAPVDRRIRDRIAEQPRCGASPPGCFAVAVEPWNETPLRFLSCWSHRRGRDCLACRGPRGASWLGSLRPCSRRSGPSAWPSSTTPMATPTPSALRRLDRSSMAPSRTATPPATATTLSPRR